MNPACWKPLSGNSLRQAAACSIRSTLRPSSTIRSTAGTRSYATKNTASAPCTNSVRKTLYNAFPNRSHHVRFNGLHPSSAISFNGIVSSRFMPVIRRGFASQSSSSSSQQAGTSSAVSTKKSGGFMDKIKDMVKKYGYTGVAVYLGISAIDLAATFVIVKAAGMDKIETAQDWVVDHVGAYFGYKRNPKHQHSHSDDDDLDLDKVDDEQVGAIYNKASGLWSVFVIAYGIHKLLVPLRVVATSMITPPLVKWLVKKGWIKEAAKKGAAVTAGSAAVGTTKP
ncbi:hypothetical protein BC939DRAFT_434020 [Gamsiella multidivaricata]|uniref:uncharacterized protein n=1 Tax=Gamsiella multidivaricata TaxID=101098 RepID=UPI00221E4FAA|nr:uncharacterized protein BC939DRAFT_434020 [Gamsiella multidivaricata]KAG0367719.1 hypothetical protein BGZ54_003397 [Gamsiella multidivaricata]KAI7832663.1 hypothetical protein BC939DRAFT_434020 [Gamsiella multidivaricata]